MQHGYPRSSPPVPNAEGLASMQERQRRSLMEPKGGTTQECLPWEKTEEG